MLLCYSLPFIPALTLLFIQSPSRGRVYGSADLECWISQSWDTMRIAVLYRPAWLMIAGTFAIYIRVGLYIYMQVKELRALGVTGDWSEEVNRIVDTSTTERYMTRLVPSYTRCCHRQADESGSLRQQTVPDRSSNSHSASVELLRVHPGSNMAAWAYARYSFLFFIALLVTWVPSSIDRLSTLINPDYLSFGLNYVTAFVIPLQGFWNSVIYITISRQEFKALFRQLCDRLAPRVRTKWPCLVFTGRSSRTG